MKNVFKFLFVTIFVSIISIINLTHSTNVQQFRVSPSLLSNFINDTPDQDPVYMVLAPGDYRIAQPITMIDWCVISMGYTVTHFLIVHFLVGIIYVKRTQV